MNKYIYNDDFIRPIFIVPLFLNNFKSIKKRPRILDFRILEFPIHSDEIQSFQDVDCAHEKLMKSILHDYVFVEFSCEIFIKTAEPSPYKI